MQLEQRRSLFSYFTNFLKASLFVSTSLCLSQRVLFSEALLCISSLVFPRYRAYRPLRELMRRSVEREEKCGMRNETAAAQLGITCMTRCSSGVCTLVLSLNNNNILLSDAGCQNKRKLCLCDGLCGMSCVRWRHYITLETIRMTFSGRRRSVLSFLILTMARFI